jgi:signal transduction histidine kinase
MSCVCYLVRAHAIKELNMPSPEVNIPHTGIDRPIQLEVSKNFTLFPLVRHEHQGNLFLHDRHSMAIMSHEIEANVSRLDQPADVYAGFQQISKFSVEEKRYRELAGLGHTVFVFGVLDVSPPSIQGIHFVPIDEDHALAREWFVIVDAPEFFSALVAEELLELSSQAEIKNIGPNGLYQGIWTFDPSLISELVLHLRDELGFPASLQTFHASRDHMKQVEAIVASTKHLVSELELRKQSLDTQQRLYEDLVNMLVHDLRGSLTSIIGSLEVLASGRVNDPADAQLLIENSLENSRRLSNMISNMLDLNKNAAGRLEISRELIDLPDLLASVLRRWTISASWSGKTITSSIQPELPVIIGDAWMLERVFDNLLSNAIKYGSNIHFLAGTSGKFVSVSVIDDGPGIPLSDRKIVFEKFMQANLGDAQRKGTGLGLAYCKMAIEAHGGTIGIYDGQPNGTEFRILIPLSPTLKKSLIKKQRKQGS